MLLSVVLTELPLIFANMKSVENLEYNTSRNHLIMKEYGRHIQKMIEYLMTIEDKAVRQKNANTVIELMGFLNPHLKNIEDFRHKLWDHLFLISDFKLDVESPYPIPTKEILQAKPERLPYPKKYPKYNHLGKNIEVVIDKALKEENPDKKQGLANAIAYYMKLTYSNWHKELVHDDNIQTELQNLTGGQLEFTNKPFVKHRNEREREDFGGSGRNQYRKNFGGRDNRNNGGGQNRSSRNSGQNRNNNGNGGNRNFKKRY